MTILIPLIIILIAEYVGDFLLQSREMALNKSKKITTLLMHLYCIGCCLIIGFGAVSYWYVIPLMVALKFTGLYCLVHGVQDWFIWKGYGAIVHRRIMKQIEAGGKVGCTPTDGFQVKNLFDISITAFMRDKDYAEDKVFYDIIGLDRLLHILTLVILYGVFFL